MNYQWYPGHMTKARRMMQEDMKLIDLVIEIVDARIPISSRNPDIDVLAQNKSRMVLLNKSDLADSTITKEWMKEYNRKGVFSVEINSKNGNGMKDIQKTVADACRDKIERNRKRGIINRPVRAMVVGIPNVGKSTFINSYTGRACTKTGNKPGVTKGKQWIRLNKNLELLDTPGILWPKFDDKNTGMKLAFIGSINDEILITEELAADFIRFIQDLYPDILYQKYEIDRETNNSYEILNKIAVKRKCLLKEEKPDIEKAAKIVIEDFRSGRLGRISLERPNKEE